jgi:peptide/nickel transport system ATP-binding protein
VLPGYAKVSVDRLSFDRIDLKTASPKLRRSLRGGRMGMILQDPKFSLNPVMQVGQQIVEAIRIGARRISGGEARARALSMLESVHIREPDLLVADEPTSALDVTVRTQVLSIIDELVTRRGMGLILISHDLNLVSRFCDRVLVMYAGHVVEDLEASRLHDATHPYTRGLLACLPAIDGPLSPLPTLNRDASWAAA